MSWLVDASLHLPLWVATLPPVCHISVSFMRTLGPRLRAQLGNLGFSFGLKILNYIHQESFSKQDHIQGSRIRLWTYFGGMSHLPPPPFKKKSLWTHRFSASVSTSLVSKCSGLLFFPCPRPWSSHFLRKSCFFHWETLLRNQSLCPGCAHRHRGVLAPIFFRGQSQETYTLFPIMSLYTCTQFKS